MSKSNIIKFVEREHRNLCSLLSFHTLKVGEKLLLDIRLSLKKEN